MLQLYLVRHGQTEENAAHILQGHMPGHLSAEGRQQIEDLSQRLAQTHFDVLISSDLKRCTDSAAILNRPHNLNILTTPLLRERDWGPFTGTNILAKRISIDNRAETTQQLLGRAAQFLTHVATCHPDTRILIVSHGLILRAIQSLCLHKSMHVIPRMQNAELRILTAMPPFHASDLIPAMQPSEN